MSADNWGICPKCLMRQEEMRAQAEKDLAESYGKISEEEYIVKLHKFNSTPRRPKEETLREDWELGTDECGNFSITYTCACTCCGFKFKYEFEKTVI